MARLREKGVERGGKTTADHRNGEMFKGKGGGERQKGMGKEKRGNGRKKRGKGKVKGKRCRGKGRG